MWGACVPGRHFLLNLGCVQCTCHYGPERMFYLFLPRSSGAGGGETDEAGRVQLMTAVSGPLGMIPSRGQ